MAELLAACVSMLAGVIFERIEAWLQQRRDVDQTVRLDRLERQLAAQRIGAAIDRDVAAEPALARLIDEL
ncbi:MAG: hypothetical protein KI785_10800 [Devosiaceae bacterium]|nr:hypothetical protein [Devosiaceae bacterium MH13]